MPISTPQLPKLTHVAVGIVHNEQGQVLFAQRPLGKPYAGWWEFPGGKIEANETLAMALARELREELGIQILDCHPWLTQRFVYPHAHVDLQFCNVFGFKGQPQSLEGQAFAWGTADRPPLPFLPAALPLLKAMQLPRVIRFSAATEMGFESWSHALNRLQSGVVIVHEPTANIDQAQAVLRACLAWKAAATQASLTHPNPNPNLHTHPISHAARTVLISSRHPQAWWGLADGVHLTQRDLMTFKSRPSHHWVGASVHDKNSLQAASMLGCNYATLGTVLPSASHPDGRSIGWGGLSDCLEQREIATYALGGINDQHSALAQAAGAAGIAMKRGAWIQ